MRKTAEQAAKTERVADLTLWGSESDYYAQHKKKGNTFDPLSVLHHHRLNELSRDLVFN